MADASTILAKLKKEYPELQDESLMLDLEDSLETDELPEDDDMSYLDDEAPEDFMSEAPEEGEEDMEGMDFEEDEEEDSLDYLDEAPKRKRK